MTPAEMLIMIGRAIYGQRWVAPLADDLGINRETIRRWLSGKAQLPNDHGVFSDALELLKGREKDLMGARHTLVKWMIK